MAKSFVGGLLVVVVARWGLDDIEIWVGRKVGALEKPFVSQLR